MATFVNGVIMSADGKPFARALDVARVPVATRKQVRATLIKDPVDGARFCTAEQEILSALKKYQITRDEFTTIILDEIVSVLTKTATEAKKVDAEERVEVLEDKLVKTEDKLEKANAEIARLTKLQKVMIHEDVFDDDTEPQAAGQGEGKQKNKKKANA
jgi:hypothetical protein